MSQLISEHITVVQLRINFWESLPGRVNKISLYALWFQGSITTERNKKTDAYAEEKRLKLFLGCDANSHHIKWRSMYINSRDMTSSHAQCTMVWILNSESFWIVKRRSKPTFINCRRQKIIDITICSKKLINLIGDWKVFGEPSDSDHRQTCFALKHVEEKNGVKTPNTQTEWVTKQTLRPFRIKLHRDFTH